VRIRHADPTRDAFACAAIYAPFVRDSAISFEEVVPDERELRERIERVSLTHPWLVAEDECGVTGFAYAAQHHERAAYRWSTDVAVYVDAAHHRRGIGRALYEALFRLLIRQRFHVACAGVTLPNRASVALHEALGFRPVGVYRRVGWKRGSWWDVGWWQLQLIEPGPGAPAEPGPPARLDAAT